MLDDKDSIITFNWDLLLDNVLGRKKMLAEFNGKGDMSKYSSNHYYQFLLHLSALGEMTWKRSAVGLKNVLN